MGGDRSSQVKKRDSRKVRQWLEKKLDITVDEIRVRLASQGTEVSNTSIRRLFVADEGLS